jgi:hypothetical protein
MLKLARSRRSARNGEWTASKAVTFIVTLAASQSVTLASARTGMSRKSAYALKRRDPVFAQAWEQALCAATPPQQVKREGNKVDEVDRPRNSLSQGNNSHFPAPPGAALSRDLVWQETFFNALKPSAATRKPLCASGQSPNRRSPCAPAAFSSPSSS